MGSAQNNAVSILPQKAWPYYNAYPSPPSYGLVGGYHTRIAEDHPGATEDTFKAIYFRNAEQPSNPPDSTDVCFMETNDSARYLGAGAGWGEYAFSLWEGTNGGVSLGSGETASGSLDPDIRLVFTNGYRPYLISPLYNYKDLNDQAAFGTLSPLYFKKLEGAIRYVQAALWYCGRPIPGGSTTIDGAYYNPSSFSSVVDAVSRAQTQANLFRSVPAANKWKYVQSLRFLAHAASCLTGYPETSAAGGLLIPPVDFPFATKDKLTIPTTQTTSIALDQYKVIYYHELAMHIAMLYAASQPYDWGAPRPSQRALFTDNPLLEYDLISGPDNPKVGQISGAAVGVTGSQWRPIPARPIANIGRSASFPNTAIPSSTWGNPTNFTLTKQFEPAERCRELVFWSVDWMSYVDAETAPSILEASRIPFAAPINVPSVTSLASFANTDSMRLEYWRSRSQFLNSFLNPEMDRAFSNSVSAFPTGFNWPFRNVTGGNAEWNGQNDEINGVKLGVNINAGEIWWARSYLRSGDRLYSCHGADRNGNRTLDRGPVPQSTRLRATLLARYNFYDPRLTLRLR
jgi:hypothetical protein